MSEPTRTNIYPNPGFEIWGYGYPGAARTGAQCGHLKVETPRQSARLQRELRVEPFATYKAEAWVRARLGSGAGYALYCSSLDSFGEAFVRAVPLQNWAQWTRVELTFVSPADRIQVNPLMFAEAENSEAWIDDIVVERVKEPAETIGALLSADKVTNEEVQLLGRYHLSAGDVDAARGLMQGAAPYPRADLACLLVDRMDAAERRAMLLDLVARMTPPPLVERFLEVSTANCDVNGKLEAVLAALAATPGQRTVPGTYRTLVAAGLKLTEEPLVCSELDAIVEGVYTALEAILEQDPAEYLQQEDCYAMRADLTRAKQLVAEARELPARRRDSLGKCEITIGGTRVSAATHAIVAPAQPTPQEAYAAADLRSELELITGEALPLVSEAELGERIPVSVGRTGLIEKLGLSVDFEALGADGIVIKTAGPALVLAGNKRGVLYAVYSFLEEHVGCRWLMGDCCIRPKEGSFDLPELDEVYVPPLMYRDLDEPLSRDPKWAVRNKINGSCRAMPERLGGRVGMCGHGFWSLVPIEEHFETHPEYFPIVTQPGFDGERKGKWAQLCMTNPGTTAVATENALRLLREHPDAMYVSAEQIDHGGLCECENCRALVEAEGSESGPLLHFVNAIADGIKDEFPDKRIITQAYQWSQTAPKTIRPRPNVLIRYCSTGQDYAHPFDDTTPRNFGRVYNRNVRGTLEGWTALGTRMHIWDYVVNYAWGVLPHPNLHVIAPNIRFHIAQGAVAIYQECAYYTRGGEMGALRAYIIAKSLWEPDYDTDRAVAEFTVGYFGLAGEHVRAYVDLLHHQVETIADGRITMYDDPEDALYFTPEFIAESVALFDRAEAAVAADAVLLHRVQVARAPIIFLQMARLRDRLKKEGQAAEEVADPLDQLLTRFCAICRAEGLVRVGEATPKTLEWFEETVRAELAAVRGEAEAPPEEQVYSVVRADGSGNK